MSISGERALALPFHQILRCSAGNPFQIQLAAEIHPVAFHFCERAHSNLQKKNNLFTSFYNNIIVETLQVCYNKNNGDNFIFPIQEEEIGGIMTKSVRFSGFPKAKEPIENRKVPQRRVKEECGQKFEFRRFLREKSYQKCLIKMVLRCE